MMWMLRALWFVVAHDLLEYRYTDDVTGNLFSLFCSTWHAVLKMFVRLFRIVASEWFGKSLAGFIYKEEKWRNGEKKILTTCQCLNYKKSSQQLPSCVFTTRDSLFYKMFSLLFFFEQAKTVKNFSKKLFTSKIKNKLRWKVGFGT